MLSDFAKVFEWKVWRVICIMQRAHFQVRVGVFNCQHILAKISFVIFDIVIKKKTNRIWFSVAQVKFHWFGINWHVFNQSEYRNCCLHIIIQKIAPQAKSGKYYQIWFFPDLGEKNGGVLSRRMQVILDSSFARPSSAPIWGGKKGEFRDWTTLPQVVARSKARLSNVILSVYFIYGDTCYQNYGKIIRFAAFLSFI